MWYLGRPVFPLFAFALACNLIRGTDVLDYVGKLALLGVFSQPIYATLMGIDEGNTLFTLVVGALLVVVLRVQRPAVQHLFFLAGIVTIFCSLFRVRAGLDYGMAGMLFPAALYLVLQSRLSFAPWLVLLLFALNWYPDENPWSAQPVQAALFGGAASVLIAIAALSLKKRPRFLPRYALHVFYPGHLLVLLVIHLWA